MRDAPFVRSPMVRRGSHSAAHECSHVGRRPLLLAGGALAAGTLAGCLQSDETEPAPAAIPGSAQCDVCAMVIAEHPGPNGQIFYRQESPEGHDNPAWFDSLQKCFFPYKLEHDRRDWSVAAMYVTDYSVVEYSVTTDGDTPVISSHTEPASFGSATELQYVVESEVQGAMGPDFYPFSDGDDAAAFAEQYDGRVVAFDEIGEDLIGQ